MKSCEEVTRLLSASMDRQLPWQIRAGLRLHLMMCKPCHRYSVQLFTIRRIFNAYADADSTSNLPDPQPMPEDAATRIRNRLNQEMDR